MGGTSSVSSSSAASPPPPAIETKTAIAIPTTPAPDVVAATLIAVPTVAAVEVNVPVVITEVPAPAVSPSAVAPTPSEQPSGLDTLYIYYGTATGTAMGFARLLANEGKQQGFKASDLEDLDPKTLTTASSSSLSIFLMATAGEGRFCRVPLFT